MMPHRHVLRRGLTLVELVVSMTIMTILMGAMASVLVVASHAVPDGRSPMEKKTQAADVLDQIAGELFYATSITEETEIAVTFTVADRNHGDPGPETIRYAWSGTAGDPLTRQYNGGSIITVCEGVQVFSLQFYKKAMPLHTSPRVLFIALNDVTLTTQDEVRLAALESWGFAVQVQACTNKDKIALAVESSDVVYISGQSSGLDLAGKLENAPIGVVSEMERAVASALGISGDVQGFESDYPIVILDNTHEITSGFDMGDLHICTATAQLLKYSDVAPGARVLAELDSWPSLMAIKVGGELYGGGTANSRRVALPWGGNSFDFNALNDNGLRILREAIVWAAAPIVYSGAHIVLRPTEESEHLRTQTRILNMPKVNGS